MEVRPDTKMVLAGLLLSLVAALELYPRWRNAVQK
jgi:hypothetical protein